MAKPRPPSRVAGRRLRCAIYTRKSTEEGLDQAFNSLHAQREACAAFITSQRHEGWTPVPHAYDDGGFSGGSMERPGLKRLIVDIDAGRVDVVVVYKVDRLTRALSDFAKLVDLFDGRGVSFVSVTQQFNTTTSMGRLTLNVLLSFAQFEREVIGERIRDKIAASKRRGLWMGGLPPLGYDVRDRTLVVNDQEALTVVMIFRRYLALRSVHALRDELAGAGVISKQRRRPDGSAYGGQALGRGALYAMLQNRLYRGEVTHKGEVHPGEHQAIIDQALWDEVQAQLGQNREDRRSSSTTARQPSLLAGMLFDAAGQRLTPTYAVKQGTRYRYYVSASLLRGEADSKGATRWRVPAADLDAIVTEQVAGLLRDPSALLDALGSIHNPGVDHRALIGRSRELAEQLASASRIEARSVLIALGCRVVINSQTIDVAVSRRALKQRLGGSTVDVADHEPSSEHDLDDGISFSVPARLKRGGREMRIVVGADATAASPDAGLLRVLARAHDLHARLTLDPSLTVPVLAQQQQVTASHLYKLLRIRWLAPAVVTAVIEGQQPATLNATVLLRDAFRLPLGWDQQRTLLGFH